jgi:hypothetical protein
MSCHPSFLVTLINKNPVLPLFRAHHGSHLLNQKLGSFDNKRGRLPDLNEFPTEVSAAVPFAGAPALRPSASVPVRPHARRRKQCLPPSCFRFVCCCNDCQRSRVSSIVIVTVFDTALRR